MDATAAGIGEHLQQCSAEDGGIWPSEIVLWGMVSNRHMLRWLKTVVVNDEEKAPMRCQVGTGKASES